MERKDQSKMRYNNKKYSDMDPTLDGVEKDSAASSSHCYDNGTIYVANSGLYDRSTTRNQSNSPSNLATPHLDYSGYNDNVDRPAVVARDVHDDRSSVIEHNGTDLEYGVDQMMARGRLNVSFNYGNSGKYGQRNDYHHANQAARRDYRQDYFVREEVSTRQADSSAYFPDVNRNSSPGISQYDTKRKAKIRVCSNCFTNSTPSWRRSNDGKRLLCNACGLYQKLHGRPRPFSVTPDGKTKALKVNNERIRCRNCNTTETTYWRRGYGGQPLCNECGLDLKNQLMNAAEYSQGAASFTSVKRSNDPNISSYIDARAPVPDRNATYTGCMNPDEHFLEHTRNLTYGFSGPNGDYGDMSDRYQFNPYGESYDQASRYIQEPLLKADKVKHILTDPRAPVYDTTNSYAGATADMLRTPDSRYSSNINGHEGETKQ